MKRDMKKIMSFSMAAIVAMGAILASCTTCHGTGKIASTVVIDEQIERKLADLVEDTGKRQFTLKVSPILGAYLTRGWNSFASKWRRKYKCKLKVVEMTEHSILQYEFYDEKGKVLE